MDFVGSHYSKDPNELSDQDDSDNKEELNPTLKAKSNSQMRLIMVKNGGKVQSSEFQEIKLDWNETLIDNLSN